MADIDIAQAEAGALIIMEKHCVDDKEWLFCAPGGRLAIPLISPDKREHFMLDVSRAQIKLTKATCQNRARQAIVLIGSISTARLTGTRMGRKSLVRISTSTVKASATNGLSRPPLADTRIR
jgi:hypothetical protein